MPDSHAQFFIEQSNKVKIKTLQGTSFDGGTAMPHKIREEPSPQSSEGFGLPEQRSCIEKQDPWLNMAPK